MFNRASAPWISQFAPMGDAVAETIDRGFDWGSAVAGAGVGAGSVLLLVAVAITARGRRTGSRHRGGSCS